MRLECSSGRWVPLPITLVLDSGPTLSATHLYPQPWAEVTKRPVKVQPEKMLGGKKKKTQTINSTDLPKNSEIDGVKNKIQLSKFSGYH